MAIDFRQSLDRTLSAFARPQRVVRQLLAEGTRGLRHDDSRGAVHRAACGSTLLSQTLYALTYLVRPRTPGKRAEIYVRLGSETYAVSLAKDEGNEWEASRITKVDVIPV